VPEYILETRDIDFTYMDGTKAINKLTIKIPRGKKIAVIGNNGAGKTTLFLHFNGINRPDVGQICINGEPIDYRNKAIKELRKKIGIVFQEPDNQLFSASVYQDVSFGPVNLGWSQDKARKCIEQALRQTGTWELKDKPTHFLSYGQKKRVAIAGVLVMDPEVIILDEPTAGLDPVHTRKMMDLLNDLNQEGTTVILSSHNMDEVYAWADYIFVMVNGQIIGEGLPVEVFRDKEVLMKANLSKPWVIDIFDQLISSGKVDNTANIPTNREELLEIIENGIYRHY
jgi:cobalt/nickel transport system ATP-binding protein